jgi:pseudouridine-5'-phosphate glycosidase
MTPDHLIYEADIREAIASGGPVVALESTIVTHGMPWPQNVEAARAVEADIRAAGATPAAIAVIDGAIRIGLDEETLIGLAKSSNVMKLSRADLPYAVAQGRTGSTTVAATMIAARLAGIEVFATGGIGGVHRGAETSFDISADLEELSRTPVIVVAAGAKAILDIAKTLEVLESKGVPVAAYRSDDFPAFWCRDSGLKAPLRLDSAAEIARFQKTRRELGDQGGLLIANPIPSEAEIPLAVMAPFIDQAIADALENRVSGKEVTPYILDKIFDLTEGRSLTANIALVRSNARLAADVAVELAGLSNGRGSGILQK